MISEEVKEQRLEECDDERGQRNQKLRHAKELTGKIGEEMLGFVEGRIKDQVPEKRFTKTFQGAGKMS